MSVPGACQMSSVAGLSLALFSWFLAPLLPATRITEEAAKSIKPGMTLRQVEEILGPERDETRGRAIGLCPPETTTKPRKTVDRCWVSDRAAITVGFDQKTGCVVDICCIPPIVLDPSLRDSVPGWMRDLLGRFRE